MCVNLEDLSSVTQSDLLTTANNTIATANNVLTHSDSILTLYLGIASVFIVAVTFVVQIYLSRDRKENMEKAINKVVDDFGKNEELRQGLIKIILEDDKFKERFKILIDTVVNDKLDDKVENDLKQKDFLKGLKDEK